ncbi:MAG: nucleoside-diphosphate kinase [Patescibacteria group bacterium]
MERTLVIIKPDAVQRGISGEIIARFEKAGIKVVGLKMLYVSKVLANKHYPADRVELVEGIGKKTLENYEELKLDAKKELGTTDPKKIGELVRTWLVEFIRSGPVFALVLEAPGVIEYVRKITGHTFPLKADPGTIRSQYSFDSTYLANISKRPVKNLIHASGNTAEAQFEVGLWFKDEELHDYDAIHHKHMLQN